MIGKSTLISFALIFPGGFRRLLHAANHARRRSRNRNTGRRRAAGGLICAAVGHDPTVTSCLRQHPFNPDLNACLPAPPHNSRLQSVWTSATDAQNPA